MPEEVGGKKLSHRASSDASGIYSIRTSSMCGENARLRAAGQWMQAKEFEMPAGKILF